MKIPFQSSSPRKKFILLQIGALVFTGAIPSILPVPVFMVWGTVLALTGLGLALVGFSRSARNGENLYLFPVIAVVVFGLSIFAWGIVLMLVAGFLHSLFETRDFVARGSFQYLQLPVFTTGCMAYFGVGPFRSRVFTGQRARQVIVGNRDLRLGGSAAPAIVARAEALLGLRVSDSYREFLLDYGEIHAPRTRILGLSPGTDLNRPTLDDFVGATLAAWQTHGLPKGYFVCATEADGAWACVDTVAPRNGEGQVVRWDTAGRTMAGLAANSFSEYLAASLARR